MTGEGQQATNPWASYGLRENPFFTSALLEEEGVSQGIHLFRGAERAGQAEKVVRSIGGRRNSVTLVEGPSGDGKTSFVNRVKYLLLEQGQYIVCPGSIPVESGVTGPRQLAAEILHGSLSAFRSHPELGLESEEVEEEAEGLIIDELVGVSETDVSLSYILSVGWTRSSILNEASERPLSEWMDAIKSVRDIAESAGLRGIVLHINNLDQAARSDAGHVGGLFGDVKDLLQVPGLHFLLCADRAFREEALIDRHWSRDVLGFPETLEPLTFEDVEGILEARYLDESMEDVELVEPVEPSTVARLYEVLNEDLRLLFDQLETVFIDEIGPTPNPETRGYDEIIEILVEREQTARHFLDQASKDILDVMRSGSATPDGPLGLDEIVEEASEMSKPEVQEAIEKLVSEKHVAHAPEGADGPGGYHLAGLPLLALEEGSG